MKLYSLRWFPAVAVGLSTLYILSCFKPPKASTPFNLNSFGQLPVLNGGRIKPLDTLARTSLLMMSGKQTVRLEGRSLTPMEWLTELMFEPEKAGAYPVFEIDDPDVLGVLGIQQTTQRRFAWTVLEPKAREIERQAMQAGQAKAEQRSRFQTAIVNLQDRILLYRKLQTTLNVPAMATAWRTRDASTFNQSLKGYHAWLSEHAPLGILKTRFECVFNYVAPFYQSLLLYLMVFLLVLGSWMVLPPTLNRTAFYVLNLAFTIHTLGILSRIYLQGRPPVTNLYSSAIFVGWVAVLLGIILERIYRNGIGSMVAALIGFMTLIIAHHLASTGDTLEMMRAVLDSNFWLATHVVCITIGYGSTFLSGFLATIYIFRKLFDKGWSQTLGKNLERMVYGIVCFATLFSFVGTILGGIWADQSWGRFWGWDPKENGALMIVLWNVFILHARWGGFADGKKLMRLAVVGNIVTSLSWFGVNMLGIGLHSYGFMDKAFLWLLIFIISQILIIGVSFIRPPALGRLRP